MYKRRTFVLLRAVAVYVLSKAFDYLTKQPSVVFSFCQGCILIRRNKMRKNYPGSQWLVGLTRLTSRTWICHLGSSAVHSSLAQDILWWCLVLFQLVSLTDFMYFNIRNPKKSCSRQITDISDCSSYIFHEC